MYFFFAVLNMWQATLINTAKKEKKYPDVILLNVCQQDTVCMRSSFHSLKGFLFCFNGPEYTAVNALMATMNEGLHYNITQNSSQDTA